MNDLQQWALDPTWGKMRTSERYFFPLKIAPGDAYEQGMRLKAGIPFGETYGRRPFICALSPQSHIGPYMNADDFLVLDGTPVIAARAGTIIECKESSNSWGDGDEFRDLLNYLTIEHEGGEYSQYCHLAQNSVKENGLSVGSSVTRGQQIARVGKTGWTDRDHLHFIVFRLIENKKPGFDSLRVRFYPFWYQRARGF